MKKILAVLTGLSFALSLAACKSGTGPGAAVADAGAFFTPADPPSSRYVIDAKIGPGGSTVEGREKISFNNSGSLPIAAVAFDWNVSVFASLEVSTGGRKLFPSDPPAAGPLQRPILVPLPSPLAPGAGLDIDVAFSSKVVLPKGKLDFLSSNWYPRLWWDGLDHHDAFSVKVETPEGVTVAASGRLDPRTGRYEAAAAKTFGLYFAPGVKVESRDVEGVRINSYFTGKGAKAAAVCLETAADAVKFYKNWLGFYPFAFLNIIPGGPGRWGGYPVATGIVAIHGLETYVDGEPPLHWQHITSHEIGHQYWGEWVIDPDMPAWVWIAGGIFADTEYMIARGFEPARRTRWTGNYINAIPRYHDMALDAPPDREDAVEWDFNNTVIHSKGPAVIYALDSVLGRDVFMRVYKRCLRDFGSKRLGWRDLRAVAEAESGQSLGWFFDAWVRTNQYLCYGVESKATTADGNGGFTSVIRMKKLGTMAMPVPVRAIFEDGSTQDARNDRTKLVTTLTFKSRSPLKDIVIDPEKKMAKVETPPAKISAAAERCLAFGWKDKEAPAIYDAVKGEPIATAEIWYDLGLGLYGANRLDDAVDCFARTESLKTDPLWKFGARGWLGIIEDLKGHRAAALAHYKAALAIAPDRPLRHDQFHITFDKAWLGEWMKRPFTRESIKQVPDHPTASQLSDVVNAIGWGNGGETPILVYRKAAEMTIDDGPFWFRLGLLLFDTGRYRESLEAFTKGTTLEKEGARAFASRVWQGHMNDLLGNRAAAVAAYKDALAIDPGLSYEHNQWKMVLNRDYVGERLATPFTWKKE
jgi:tetratricopeptide (TPR) repeat protein